MTNDQDDEDVTITGIAKDNFNRLKEQAKYDLAADPKRSISARMRAIAYLAAIGMTNKEIAQQLGVNTSRITLITKSDSFQLEVEKIQHDMFFKDPQKMFMKILPKAVARAYNIMVSAKTKDATVVDTAFKFMDRALGKPVQEIKQDTGGIKDLIDKLDDMAKKTAQDALPKQDVIDAQFTEVKKLPEVIEDEIEKFVKENYK